MIQFFVDFISEFSQRESVAAHIFFEVGSSTKERKGACFNR